MPDSQGAAKRRGLQLVEDSAYAHGTAERPSGAARLTADNAMDVQEMARDGLERLRRITAVMLDAIRVSEQRIE